MEENNDSSDNVTRWRGRDMVKVKTFPRVFFFLRKERFPKKIKNHKVCKIVKVIKWSKNL